MTTTTNTERIKVSRADKGIKAIIAATFPQWAGRKVHVRSATEYKMANFWDGGSRDYVLAYALASGRAYGPAIHTTNPMNGAAHSIVAIPEGVLIVEHSVFCGQDAGITIYANPANMPRVLATTAQKVVGRVEVNTTAYRRSHGAEPRGRGSWIFVMGRTDYQHTDETDDAGRPLLYTARSVDGRTSMTFGEARKLAVAEALSRGVAIVGVAS